ncbi:MAG: histidine phosphatase family protein [Flavobacteriales bacterium]|nr:histidine phosphatase family protein [Flavobacteriales bacterium]
MKTIFLLRHAKSDWSNNELLDYDRPLNKRGQKDAFLMSKLFKEKLSNVDAIYSSTALRAEQTTLVFSNELRVKKEDIYWKKEIYDYHYEMQKLIHILLTIENRFHQILFVGHNPGISEMASYLCGELSITMPTCCILKIELQIKHWEEISAHCGNYIFQEYPKKY